MANVTFKVAGFAGRVFRCTRFKNTRKGLRCEKYVPSSGKNWSPVCDGRLVDGGRSPGLVRAYTCTNARKVAKMTIKTKGRKTAIRRATKKAIRRGKARR